MTRKVNLCMNSPPFLFPYPLSRYLMLSEEMVQTFFVTNPVLNKFRCDFDQSL